MVRVLRTALAACATSACLAGAARATPPPLPIEGVWSFGGGRVAVQQLPDGTFAGTVVAATRFAECQHPVGEVVWTRMRATSAGDYFGFHQWLFEGSCAPNATLGLTAWRPMEAEGGAYFLRVCFSEPGRPQPEISASGLATNASYGCENSALVAAAPATSGAAAFHAAVGLPSPRRCLSRRAFTIHLRDPRNDPLREVVVRLAGKRLRTVRHGDVFASRVDLRGLPKGTFTVRISLTTVLGQRLAGARTYHTCTPGKHRR
jgi:hypothetical protein